MVAECCALAVNPRRDGRVIYDGPNFFVSAALGSMGLPGYVLIVSQEHYIGSGDMPPELHEELDDLMGRTRGILRATYGQEPIFFEHGPRVGRCGWGGCIDHAHIHAVPCPDISELFAVDLMDNLTEPGLLYRVDRTEGFKRAVEIAQGRHSSYVMLEDPTRRRLFSEVTFPGQSQWMRRLMARRIHTPHWNWRESPYRERALQTAQELAGKL